MDAFSTEENGEALDGGEMKVHRGEWRKLLKELNDNRLTGSIPPELGKLSDLFDLNVANNYLEGPIPDNLSSCVNLNSLNLSDNHLAGYIPGEFGNFTKYHGDLYRQSWALWLLAKFICRFITSSRESSNLKSRNPWNCLGGLVILLMILVAVCRPHNPPPFPDGSITKPVNVTPKLVILHMNMALHVGDKEVYYSHYPQSSKEFETELETVGSIKHRNLVSLQGYSLSPSGNLLFYDYMENGSLWIFCMARPRRKSSIGTHSSGSLWEPHKAWLICTMTAVHALHRDVKSSNILLDKDYEAHLTDFGIAKSLCVSKTHTSTYVMGTIGYIDPEYARTSRLNEKSDVYSYGVVLLEILTGKKAVDNECNLHHLVTLPIAEVFHIHTFQSNEQCGDGDGGSGRLFHMQRSREVKKVFQLALLCTKRQPSDRPTMHEVTRVLAASSGPPVPEARPGPNPTPAAVPPSYIDEYSTSSPSRALTCAASMSSSDAQLFLKFGEVISQNTD
uniref:Protein kinase domain-containing protein n=1 Tax=Ananas comosus var. bracteatus TaxID=296719 RepID=A0A6V7P5S3_ANACO|nr:unnamed protein product [Ananas comosus var. bracteatus]